MNNKNDKEMNYTKGKWRMCSFADGHVENENGRLIAACMGYSTNVDNGEHRKENIANAKLIIKAPKMYEALKNAMARIEKKIPIPTHLEKTIESLLKELES